MYIHKIYEKNGFIEASKTFIMIGKSSDTRKEQFCWNI